MEKDDLNKKKGFNLPILILVGFVMGPLLCGLSQIWMYIANNSFGAFYLFFPWAGILVNIDNINGYDLSNWQLLFVLIQYPVYGFIYFIIRKKIKANYARILLVAIHIVGIGLTIIFS
jgi:hypothetical protein